MTSLASLIYKNILIGLSSNEIANDLNDTQSLVLSLQYKTFNYLHTTPKLLAYQFYINLINLEIS